MSQPLPPECPFFPPYTPRGGWSEDCWSDKAWKEAVGAKCYVFPLRDCGRLIADLTALQPWSGHLLFQWIGESFQLRLCGPVDRTLVQPLIARATETMAQFRGQQWCPITDQLAPQTWLASKHYGEGANALNALVKRRSARHGG